MPASPDYRAVASSPRAALDASRSVTRVDAEGAALTVPENVGDLLSQAPGLVVSRTSSVSAVPIVRGLTGSSVLLMVDELRLNDSLTRPGGSALLNLVDPSSVQDVEVLRGPASVRYGSDALGGVVRVTTRSLGARERGENAAPHFHAELAGRAALAERAGRIAGSLEGTWRAYGARISGGRGHSGLLLRGGGLGEQSFTGHDDATFASRLQWSPSPSHQLALTHQSGHLWDVPRSDVSTPEDVRSTAALDRDAGLLQYAAWLPDQRLRVNAFAGIALRRELRLRERPDRLNEERDHVLSYQVGARASLGLGGGGSVELGADAALDRVGSGATVYAADGGLVRERGRYLDGSRYDMAALYALWSQPLTEAWSLLAGGRVSLVHASAPIDPLFDAALQERLDRNLFGPVGTLGTRVDLNPHWSVMLSLLSGFRAPNLEDFQAFGGGARGFTIPNPRLHEERSYTLEAGVKLSHKRIQATAFAFASLLRGLLVRVPGVWDGSDVINDEAVLQRQNASRALLLGGEAELRARFDSGLYAAAALWAVWGETERTSETGTPVVEPASKIPGPAAALRIGFGHPTSALRAEAALAAQLPQSRLSESDHLDVRLCPEGPEGCARVPGYADVTVRAGWRLSARLELNLALENLFDVGYRTHASGAYAPGRNLVLAVHAKL